MKDLQDFQSKTESDLIEDLQQKNRELAERLAEFELIEEALRNSEERYRSVIDNVEVGIALISPAMEIISLNNQMRKWFPLIDINAKPICYAAFNKPPRNSVCPYCPTLKTLLDGRVHQSITELHRETRSGISRLSHPL